MITPIIHSADVYVIELASDPHGDVTARLQGGGPQPIRIFAQAMGVMGADAGLLLGDIVSDVKPDGPDEGVIPDCTALRVFSVACPTPSIWGGMSLVSELALYGGGRPVWMIAGNHDGHPRLPGVTSHDELTDWWTTYVDPLSQPGVVGARSTWDHYEVRIDMPSGSWSLLLISDLNNEQDRAIGGRCDLSDTYTEHSTCGSTSFPAGVVSPDQQRWLDDRISAAELAGRHVLIGLHAPVPHTVVLTGDGEAQAAVCPGITIQGTEGHPRDADLLPLRTDLDLPIPGGDGRTPLQYAVDLAAVTVAWTQGQPPDLDWFQTLLDRHGYGAVDLVVSGHNHLPVPDLQYAGRGVRFDDLVHGTTFLAHGPLTSAWCTTPGTCFGQSARLELHSDGTWEWERWLLHGGWKRNGCSSTATKPPSVPGPFGLPLEMGG